jgi:hypothetical protein
MTAVFSQFADAVGFTAKFVRCEMQDYFETPECIEARAIMRLVSLGTTTLEDARELIAIPERQEQALNVFVASAGKEGAPIGRALAFRHKVLIEFEKLAALTQFNNSVAA